MLAKEKATLRQWEIWLALKQVGDTATNLQKRLFGENRRRVKVIPHFFSENTGMKLI